MTAVEVIRQAVNAWRISNDPADPHCEGMEERIVRDLEAAGYDMGQSLLAHYSRALDEIYRLRKAMAYEATLLDAHLRWKSLPSTARQAMDRQAQRLYQAARGEAEQAYKAVDGRALREALLDAGAEEGLSRGQWEGGGDG